MRALTVKLSSADFLWPRVETLDEKLLAFGVRQLNLDFRDVKFVSGQGLGKLTRLHRKLDLTLCNVCPHVYEVFEITRLTGILDVRPRAARKLALIE